MDIHTQNLSAEGRQIPIRPAASILIIRDSDNGIEVLTMKRAMTMRFLPGYLAFPGGSLQPEDWQVAQTRIRGELTSAKRSDDVVFAVAAIRETAEEIGWLPAIVREGGAPVTDTISAVFHEKLLSGGDTFLKRIEESAWWIDAAQLRVVGRWVTPEYMPARFDTRFFVVRGDEIDGPIRLNEAENVWAKWCNPKELLNDIKEGRQEAVPPTIAMLKHLAKAPNAAWCMSELSVPGPDEEIT